MQTSSYNHTQPWSSFISSYIHLTDITDVAFYASKNDTINKYRTERVQVLRFANKNIPMIILLQARKCGLWQHCLLGPPSVNCGHKIVLGRMSFSGGMSFKITCIMGTFVLREVTLCRTYFMGGYVMSSGWHIFQDDVSYWNASFTGGHVLLEGISYRRSC